MVPNETVMFGMAMLGLLVAIAWVDFRTMTIPDELNIALGALGAGYQFWTRSGDTLMIASSVLILSTSFLAIRALHWRATGRVGLGLGDVKMVAAAGFWLSPAWLPFFVLIASSVALFYALLSGAIGFGRNETSGPVPFGPFLALGLFATWLAGEFSSGSALG